MYSVQCKVYSVQCTVYSVQCTVYSIQFKVYSIQFTVYPPLGDSAHGDLPEAGRIPLGVRRGHGSKVITSRGFTHRLRNGFVENFAEKIINLACRTVVKILITDTM